MLIRVRRTHKDAICNSHGLDEHDPSRRDFIRRGATAGLATLVLSKSMVGKAMAALPSSCPVPA